MNGGLVRLREALNELTPSEKKVGEYILGNPKKVVELSVAQLADYSGASQAAIVRLCKSLGLKGFPDLKLKIAGDLQESAQVPGKQGYQEISQHDSIATLIQNVSANNIQSIRDTVKILDVESVERAVDALNRAERIFFFGLGASGLIAQDAQQKFLRINRMSFTFADPHMQLTTAVTMTSKDVAVGISYSGETREVIAVLKAASERGATTISITKYGNTALHAYSQIPLCISSTENEIRSGATASRITQLNVIDILYLGVASRNYEQSVEYLERSRAAIRELGH
ncbi:transcriptional regulator, RpiR family [Paenibacillus sp. UNCCL117]|uniref:MurR/RpiR family transcriptional regulator n=1 Tax=unclassified Paenibacillus TaxID=185978 RepID=UPI00088C7F92|nr:MULTISPECIES: MurR/RpiR family transcriptional regulator [unclassified Paenibacillus]SDD39382.1 DNA-binding transcriptional regulator, MurR/RpiR family, contains HTH and SIS domains [Paenibacillus sp. cl123]SFW48381.1 transcriptional regulator, RpiR family [Paenibacillus sp. UNCCL117]